MCPPLLKLQNYGQYFFAAAISPSPSSVSDKQRSFAYQILHLPTLKWTLITLSLPQPSEISSFASHQVKWSGGEKPWYRTHMKSRFLAEIKVFERNQGKRVTKSRKMTPRPKTLILWPFSLILSKNLDLMNQGFWPFQPPTGAHAKIKEKGTQNQGIW